MIRKKRPDPICRAHSKPKPCPACASASISQRKVWQSPARKQMHRYALANRDGAFFDEEIKIIRELAGSYSTSEITDRVNKLRKSIGYKKRGIDSVRYWAQRHDVSLMFNNVHSANQLKAILGVSFNTIREWRKQGILVGKAWGKFWVYSEEELIRMVTEQPWRVDVANMAKGPVRQAAEVANRRDPWLSVHRIAALVPIPVDHVIAAMHNGTIPFRQRTGHHGRYMVQASSVGPLRELLGQARIDRSQRYSVVKLAQVLGTRDKTIKWWRENGWLKGERHGALRMFSEAEIIHMVTSQPWLVDIRRIQPGPVRDAFKQHQRNGPKNTRDRWITVPEAAALVPTSAPTVLKYIHQGDIEFKHRTRRMYAVKRASVAKLRNLIEHAKKEGMLKYWADHKTNESSQAA